MYMSVFDKEKEGEIKSGESLRGVIWCIRVEYDFESFGNVIVNFVFEIDCISWDVNIVVVFVMYKWNFRFVIWFVFLIILLMGWF